MLTHVLKVSDYPLENNMVILNILGWIVAGVIVGFIASKVVNLRGDDPRMGIGAAAGGALVAGILHTLFSDAEVAVWNPWGILFAAIGGLVAVVIWHVVRSRSITHDTHTSRRSY